MTHQTPLPQALAGADAGRQIAQLREVLALVRSIGGGCGEDPGSDAALDEAARVSSFYEDSLPIAQRRFDALVGETVAWASAGVEALSLARAPAPAAAARLADELDRTIGDLLKLLRL